MRVAQRKIGFLIAAMMAVFLFPSPASSEIPGDGRPVAILWCDNPESADVAIELLVQRMSYLPSGCHAINHPSGFIYAPPVAKDQVFAGPLKDFEGDSFLVAKVTLEDGRTIFPFVWWGEPRFSPIGWRI